MNFFLTNVMSITIIYVLSENFIYKCEQIWIRIMSLSSNGVNYLNQKWYRHLILNSLGMWENRLALQASENNHQLSL